MNNAPIGIYDSGLGGLTVWREVRKLLPEESLSYLGDGKNCPYGSRSRGEVQALADAGVRLCVASGTDKPLVDAALAHLGLLDRFEFTLSCQTPGGKQSPEVYLRALDAFGSPDPGQVTVFEDSPTALATARRLGVRTVAVRDAFTADAWPGIGAFADELCESWPAWLARATSNQEE